MSRYFCHACNAEYSEEEAGSSSASTPTPTTPSCPVCGSEFVELVTELTFTREERRARRARTEHFQSTPVSANAPSPFSWLPTGSYGGVFVFPPIRIDPSADEEEQSTGPNTRVNIDRDTETGTEQQPNSGPSTPPNRQQRRHSALGNFIHRTLPRILRNIMHPHSHQNETPSTEGLDEDNASASTTYEFRQIPLEELFRGLFQPSHEGEQSHPTNASLPRTTPLITQMLAQLLGVDVNRIGDYVFTDQSMDSLLQRMMDQAQMSNRRPGLNEEQLEALLKKQSFKTLSSQLDFKSVDSTCPICRESYGQDDEICKLPGCVHLFHYACIAPWLQVTDTCPVCRTPIKREERVQGNSETQ